jgi:diguanylate cyclase (GGDEF)-like protein
MEAAQKIRRVIEEFHFENQENQPTGNLTISGGIAVLPTDGRNTAELIEHADQGLYQSKRLGRNSVSHLEVQGLGAGSPAVDERYENSLPRIGD